MNLRSGIGWKFPPLGGGEGQGFEHAGMAHFQGNLLGSLAREVIQNSLDARLDHTKPVDVTFEMKDIDLREHLCGDELRGHLLACAESATGEKAKRFFEDAAALLDQGTIPFLGISDGNTTGLGEKQWKALVKMQGDSAKRDSVAGGSFGIGKNAPFAVSPLRTVCYWTCATNGSEAIEKFQAKAILMSHDWRESGVVAETQGAGYYGLVDACREIRKSRIPPVFRNVDRHHQPVGGTTVWIAGFRTDGEWQQQIARSVIANYFYAIDHGQLDVLLDPGDAPENPTTSLGRGSVADAFDHLAANGEPDQDLQDARTFWAVQHKRPPKFEENLDELGQVKLWIEIGDDLPKRVALIRGTGMLVTAYQRGLRRFSGLQNFAAVCVFESDEANELLRRMENPAHDQFEPQRLPEQDRRQGRAALDRVVEWIREKLNAVAAPPESDDTMELDELARFLPDLDAPGPLGAGTKDGVREKAFGTPGLVVSKEHKRRVRPGPLPSEAEHENGHEAGGSGGAPVGDGGGETGGGRGGSGDGDRTGGTGSRSGTGRASIQMQDVRVLPVDGQETCARVAFTPEASGTVRLSLEEAGDSNAQPIAGVRLFDEMDQEITATGIELEANRRTFIVAKADGRLTGVALRLTTNSTIEP